MVWELLRQKESEYRMHIKTQGCRSSGGIIVSRLSNCALMHYALMWSEEAPETPLLIKWVYVE
jgi:hypothetical protein